ERMWQLFCVGAVKNGLIWGGVIALGISSNADSHWATTFYLLIAIAFSNASIFTLGLNRPVHRWFIASLNLPPIVYLLYLAQNNGDQALTSIGITLGVAAIYSVVQGRVYYERFLDKINADHALLKSQQDLLEQRAMTEHANRLASLGEVSAGVAHEINNPLSIVTGSLNLLETNLKSNSSLNAQHANYIQRSFKALERIQKIVKAMSILSLRSSSPTRLEEYPNVIVEQALSIFNEKIYQNRIIIKRDLRSEEPLSCDPTQLTQILVNLLNNAIDAVQNAENDADRWILIETETVGSRVVLSVSNGGAGIKPEVTAKLFTPFFTTKPVGLGTGLGLSISRSIALQHQGDLNYEPQGNITRFRLSLPHSVL
ncbi:MAG: GHKL domain-containing protein, partial [Bdellovibrionaceae bacterium]|nr:GHKL domain-containing protein [Pseudobdellovibrionaceae bacterium]